MVGGAICGSRFKVGTGFTFSCQSRSEGLASWMSLYCGELGAWAGTSTFSGHPYYPAPPGGTVVISDSSSYVVEPSSISIESADFCSVTTSVSGKGSVSVGGTEYGSYRKAGDSITFTATPATGYRLKKMLVNGSEVSTSGGAYTTSINQDIACIAYFVPVSYTVTCNTPSGGTVSFTKNGGSATAPFTAAAGDLVVCTATPDADKMVQAFVLDGTTVAGGSTGVQNFSFTIYERDDGTPYECSVTFNDRATIVDSVVGKSSGDTDDAVVTTGGSVVSRNNGMFSAVVGNSYAATAHDPTIFRVYNGWVNTNGDVVSTSKQYSWTQGYSSVSIVASYSDNSLYAESFYVGTSTSDYGVDSTAYIAGCRAEISREEGTSKGGRWLGGTRTVTATATPDNWTFRGVYVGDASSSGGTRFYNANGASSVTFENYCDANIYALFSNGEETEPADSDQGNSSVASGAASEGLYSWGGGSSNLTMRWHSKRFIASMPMTISTARVYAEGYATNGVNDVKLKCMTFHSPESTDSRVTETTAKSQNAYRMPMRRPEKYIEVEVSAPHEIDQIAIATGMEALWQA